MHIQTGPRYSLSERCLAGLFVDVSVSNYLNFLGQRSIYVEAKTPIIDWVTRSGLMLGIEGLLGKSYLISLEQGIFYLSHSWSFEYQASLALRVFI